MGPPPPPHSVESKATDRAADGRQPRKPWSKPIIKRMLDAALDTGTGATPNPYTENPTYRVS